MKIAPLFRGKKITDGKIVEGDFWDKTDIDGVRINSSDGVVRVDPDTVEQIGGDLFEENKELKGKLAQAEETADHFKGRAEELAANIKQIHKEYGCELMGACDTIWEHASNVQTENAELKRQLAALEK